MAPDRGLRTAASTESRRAAASGPRNQANQKSSVILMSYGACILTSESPFKKINDLGGRFKSTRNHLLLTIDIKSGACPLVA